MQKPFKTTDLVYLMKGLVAKVTTPSIEPPPTKVDGKVKEYFS